MNDDYLELLNMPLYRSSKYVYSILKDKDGNIIKDRIGRNTFVLEAKDKYTSTIDTIKKDSIKWEDLYDVNTARYTRKDAHLKLELSISNSNIVSKYIAISDAPAQPANVKFLEKTISRRPSMTEIDNTFVVSDRMVRVYDQYGQENNDRDLLYTVSDYTENPDGRKDMNYTIEEGSNKNSKVTGVELGDSYTLTATVENSGLTDKTTITAGGDNAAKIVSNKVMSESDEYKLRSEHLGYNR